jgi:hypothetical protein
MKIEKLQLMMYAQGFIESFINEYLESLPEEGIPDRMRQQADQLSSTFATLKDGFKDLRQELADYQVKIETIKDTLK